jgi:hypothetical protein
VDPELVALTSTAANTVVTLLATDGWERAKTGLGGLWRRVHSDRADDVEVELQRARAEVLTASTVSDAQADEVKQALTLVWQGRLQLLLAMNPDLADALRRLLDEQFAPFLPVGGPAWTGKVDVKAEASGHGRNYVVGQGEQHITSP